MSTGHDHEERGFPPSTTSPIGRATQNPQDPHHPKEDASTSTTTPSDPIVPINDKLANFRTLTGINSAPSLSTVAILQRPAPNLGIYARTVRAESQAALLYKVVSTLINSCLGLQIIVATALTALGAASGPHTLVTILGAINTIIAGFLTYLKGSGLPNRLKYYENEWTKVREYIEQREREFGREGCKLDVEREILIVERMYEEVREDVEANTPDSYTNVGEGKDQKGRRPRPLLAIEESVGGGGRDPEKMEIVHVAGKDGER
jgi:hypothetical protein